MAHGDGGSGEAAAAAAAETKEEGTEASALDVKPEGSHSATGLVGTLQQQANPAPVPATSAVTGTGAASARGPANHDGGATSVIGAGAVSRDDTVPVTGMPGSNTRVGPNAGIPGRPRNGP